MGARGFVAESFVSGMKKLGFGGRKLKLLLEEVGNEALGRLSGFGSCMRKGSGVILGSTR